MLKADLHIHTNLDPKDGIKAKKVVTYSPYELIDKASYFNFTHLSFTHHEKLIYTQKLKDYAASKNIELIKGVEALIEGKEVLLYNIEKVPETFQELKAMKAKNKNIFAIAPHPFYPLKKALKDETEKHINLIDAIEICGLHHPLINKYNNKAKKIAKKYNLPLIATSDLHDIENFGRNYIYSNSKNTDIFQVIKNKQYKNISPRIKTKTAIKLITTAIKRKLKA